LDTIIRECFSVENHDDRGGCSHYRCRYFYTANVAAVATSVVPALMTIAIDSLSTAAADATFSTASTPDACVPTVAIAAANVVTPFALQKRKAYP
jgi:hypothetical protein